MMQTLLLPKTVVTTFLFVAVMYGPAHAQSATTAQVPSGTPAQMTQPVVPLADITPRPPTTSQNTENAVALLNRIESVIDDAMGEKPKKKAEKNSGQVMVDRADLDEIRAEVGQLKIALQSYGPAQSVTPVLPTQ